MALGITEPADVFTLGDVKVRNWYTGERWNSAEKVLGLCFFGPAPRSFIQVDDVVAAVRAATGWDVGVEEILEIGERAVNMARVFNNREGLSRADDRLPGGCIPRSRAVRSRADPSTPTSSRRRSPRCTSSRAGTGDWRTHAGAARSLGLEWAAETPAGAG